MLETSENIFPLANNQKIDEESIAIPGDDHSMGNIVSNNDSEMGSAHDTGALVRSNDKKNDAMETEVESSPGTPSSDDTKDSNDFNQRNSHGTRHQKSKPISSPPSLPPTIKKSKRQAERMARKLLAARQQQHDRSDIDDTDENKHNNKNNKSCDSNPPQSKKRSKETQNTTSHTSSKGSKNCIKNKTRTAVSIPAPEAATDVLSSSPGSSAKVVSPTSPPLPSPKKVDNLSAQPLPAVPAIATTTAPSSGKKKARSKTPSRKETVSEGARASRKTEVRNHPPNQTTNANTQTTTSVARKRRKLVYKATANPAQPIHEYALSIISLVCNNAFCVASNRNVQQDQQYPSSHMQPHRILDRPAEGYTPETEPPRERLMRLQLRQRFASAASTGMSPIEFSRKLLGLWGGSLEQVYNDTSMYQRNNVLTKSVPGSVQTSSRVPMKDGQQSQVLATRKAPDNKFPHDPNDMNPIPVQDASTNDLEPIPIRNANANETRATKHSPENHLSSTTNKKLKRKRKSQTPTKTESLPTPNGNVPPNGDLVGSSSPGSKKKAIGRRNGRKFLDDPSLTVLHRNLRLAHDDDEKHLNELHCFVRSELLEVYVLQTKTPGDGSTPASDNIVGIRCTRCGHLPREERGRRREERGRQTMSSFFPKSIDEIYRGVCTWQRIHFPTCKHMPEQYREEYRRRKESDQTRGKKAHWIKSAYDMGLRNIDEQRSGLTYQPFSPVPEAPDYGQPCRPKPKKTDKSSSKVSQLMESALNNDGSGLSAGDGNRKKNEEGGSRGDNDRHSRHHGQNHLQPGEVADVSEVLLASDTDEHEFQLFDFEQNTSAQVGQ